MVDTERGRDVTHYLNGIGGYLSRFEPSGQEQTSSEEVISPTEERILHQIRGTLTHLLGRTNKLLPPEEERFIIRPVNPYDLDGVLELLWDFGHEHEVLLFGCVDVSSQDRDLITSKNYDVEPVDHHALINNEGERKKYLAHIDEYLGIKGE